MGKTKSRKNSKQIKKDHYGIISSENKLENAQRERIKIIVSIRSDPTRKRKLKKNIAKKFNKLKNSVMACFQAKIGLKRPRKRENKNCLSVPFQPDG